MSKNVQQFKELFFPTETDLPVIIDDNKFLEISEEVDKDLEDDFAVARNAINNVLTVSDDTLTNLLELLKQTDNARVGEVAANLMGTISNASKDLLELHERYDKLKNKRITDNNLNNNLNNNINNQTNIQNNILFTGSSKQLLELIKETKE